MTRQRALPGFSLIEVVIATAVVVSALGAIYAVTSMSTRLTVLGQDRLIATQFAREGIEVVRQVRDANFVLNGQSCASEARCLDWWTHLGKPGSATRLVAIEPDPAGGFVLLDAPTTANCAGQIVHRALKDGHEQEFCRRVFIEPVSELGDDAKTRAIRIRSQVAWLGFGRDSFRSFSSGTITNNNACLPPNHAEATEWCTEQVTILTDWRPQ